MQTKTLDSFCLLLIEVLHRDTIFKNEGFRRRVNNVYPPSQNAPSGRTGMNAKRVSAEALACQRTCLPARSISMKAGSVSRSAKVDMLRRVSPKL